MGKRKKRQKKDRRQDGGSEIEKTREREVSIEHKNLKFCVKFAGRGKRERENIGNRKWLR